MYSEKLKLLACSILKLKVARHIQLFVKQNPLLVAKLIQYTPFLPDATHTVQRATCIIQDITKIPHCNMCNNLVKWNNSKKQFMLFCSRACKEKSPDPKEKMRQTNLRNLGVENPSQSKEIKAKKIQTSLKNWGTRHPLQAPVIQVKQKQTNLRNHGVEWNISSRYSRSKQKQTKLEKHGDENYNNQEKIKQTKQAHNPVGFKLLSNFYWLQSQYIDQQKTAVQIANELKISAASVSSYLHNFNIETNHRFSSYKCIQWLESIIKDQNIFIQHAQNIGEYKIPNTKLRVDGFCKETNTIYEFYGDFWHGNPKLFKSDFYNSICCKEAGELYHNTQEREKTIRKLGYNLTIMWESATSTT